MDIDDKVKEFKIKRTVINYKETILNVHEKQVKFAEEFTYFVYNDTKPDKVNIYPARCGMGKSVMIKALLDNLVNNYRFIGQATREQQIELYGAIVITDIIERLEEIKDTEGLQDRCYLFQGVSEEEIEANCVKEFKEKIYEQFKYPILLISTQRYFKMSKEEREFMYTWAKGKREVAFIDEKPILTSEDVVDERFLSEIKVSLHNCLEGEDKNYLLDTFEKIYSDLDYIRKNYSSQYDTMWVKKSKETLLINSDADKKFFSVLENNVSRYIFEKVKVIHRIYSEGCLFVNKKDKDQDNTRQFIVLNDNSDKFDIDKCKYHILDATSYFDIDYTIKKDLFKYIEIDDKKEKSDINIHHIPFSASQRTFKNKPEAIEATCKWINNTCGEDVFVSTYGKKKGLYQKFINELNTKEVAYYGAIKGKNNWKDKSCMVHIGFNRQADTVYLLTYLYIDKKRKHKFNWNEESDEKIKEKIDILLEVHSEGLEKGMFKDILMSNIMRSKIVVDSEQNIMRIKCRHFSNEDICNVFIIAGKTYINYVKMLCERLNATYMYYDTLPIEFEEYKILNRETEDNRETIPQKILNWINNTWNGEEIRTKSMLAEIGISQKQFDKARENNTGLTDILRKHMIKRGVYKKVS